MPFRLDAQERHISGPSLLLSLCMQEEDVSWVAGRCLRTIGTRCLVSLLQTCLDDRVGSNCSSMNTVDFQARLVEDFTKALLGSLFAANGHPKQPSVSILPAWMTNSHHHVLHDSSAYEFCFWSDILRDQDL